MNDRATGATKKSDYIFSHLDRMHERDRQTDTGPQQRPRLRIASRGKNNIMIVISTNIHYTDISDTMTSFRNITQISQLSDQPTI